MNDYQNAADIQYPIITYDTEFIGYAQDLLAFEQLGLKPNIVLQATDTDVMKTYVKEGLGVAILSGLAYDQRATHHSRRSRPGICFLQT